MTHSGRVYLGIDALHFARMSCLFTSAHNGEKLPVVTRMTLALDHFHHLTYSMMQAGMRRVSAEFARREQIAAPERVASAPKPQERVALPLAWSTPRYCESFPQL
jgi:hypothetical protein